MKDRKNVRTLMESLKWNLAVGKMVGSIPKDAEEEIITQIRTLAWVLGDDDIKLTFAEHYDKEGSHQSKIKNAQGAYLAITIEMEMRKEAEDGERECPVCSRKIT